MNDSNRIMFGYSLLMADIVYLAAIWFMQRFWLNFRESYSPLFVIVTAVALFFIGFYFVRIKKENIEEKKDVNT